MTETFAAALGSPAGSAGGLLGSNSSSRLGGDALALSMPQEQVEQRAQQWQAAKRQQGQQQAAQQKGGQQAQQGQQHGQQKGQQKGQQQGQQHMVHHTNGSHDSRKVLIAGEVVPLNVLIEPGDVLTFEGIDWSVFDVKRLDPTGTNAVILWTVFCKR